MINTFDVLYEQQFARVVSALRVAGAGPGDAEDIAQEAFVRVLVRWKGVRDPAAYLFRTAFRLQRRVRRRSILGETLSRRPPVAPATTEEAFVLRADVADALGRLSGRQRECAVLHYFVGFSTDEVADLLRIRPPTVRVHLHAARTVLAALSPSTSGKH